MHKHYRRDLLDSLKKTQRNHRMGSIRCVCVCVRENQRASANRKLMHFTIVVDRWIREITKKKERNVDVRHFLTPAERIRDGGAYNRRPNNKKKKKRRRKIKCKCLPLFILFVTSRQWQQNVCVNHSVLILYEVFSPFLLIHIWQPFSYISSFLFKGWNQ